MITTEYVPLGDIHPADVNPKRHDIELLKGSLRRFGFVDVPLADARTDKLVAGHGRIAALVEMADAGEDPPAGIVVRDGVWHVPVSTGWASTTDTEAHALGVALNRLTERGGWNAGELADLLESFALEGEEIAGLGFTTDDLDSMLAELAPAAPEADDDGEAPERAPSPARQVQGLHEVNLVLAADDHRAWGEAVARLRRAWGIDPTPAIALRALLEAVERT